jgi:raffinose/stachyose/melibiose transport system permease protein
MKSRKPSFDILLYAVLALFAVYALLPFFMTWFTAFKSKSELVTNTLGFPREFQISNIAAAWRQGKFGSYYMNSIIVVVPVVAVSIILSIMAAYALSLFKLPFKNGILGLFILGMTLPMEVAMIQIYYLLLKIDLLNRLSGLIMVQIGMSMPFGIYFLYSAFRDLPRPLIEAAEIDGVDTWKILWSILVPMMAPSLTVLSLLIFIWTWNEFLLALVIISSDTLRTLPVGMAFFQGKYVGNAPFTAMGATMMTLPVILLYIALHRHFISGMTAGAVKG